MKKWAIPLAGVAVMTVIALAGAAVALNNSGDDGGPGVSHKTGDRGESDGDGTGGDVAGICLEGAIDCDDTVDTPADPDVCIQIFPTPPECADPDEPVSNEPPVTIIDGQDPNECSFVHNLEACEKIAVALATEDLARRLGTAEDITVKSVEFVQWPDACLGISQPDVACAEVITPGYRIVLGADGLTYEYHTDGASRAVLVE